MQKSVALPLMLAIGALPMAACSFESAARGQDVPAQGTGAARRYVVRDFTSVAARGSDPVDIRVGRDFSVRAEGPAAELDQLRVARDGDTLVIGVKKGIQWGRRTGVRVLVTLPRLAGAAVDGSGRMTIDRVEGASFKAGVAGSGDLVIAAMRVGKADLGITGSGAIRATGMADAVKAGVAGSGDLRGADLQTRQAEVGVTGSGQVMLRVNGRAKVGLTGSGNADLGPNAVCTVSKTGSGTARCGRYG
ncbi:head GIN domain-containing protein [Sphingomonadaceae bacterium jetA1]|jgi:hypothetical protein|uniref:head GIN domain-containing protein n=1 Tax=Facivitalis istanbulensis TaxID=3075838 RepID=UPI00346AEC28